MYNYKKKCWNNKLKYGSKLFQHIYCFFCSNKSSHKEITIVYKQLCFGLFTVCVCVCCILTYWSIVLDCIHVLRKVSGNTQLALIAPARTAVHRRCCLCVCVHQPAIVFWDALTFLLVNIFRIMQFLYKQKHLRKNKILSNFPVQKFILSSADFFLSVWEVFQNFFQVTRDTIAIFAQWSGVQPNFDP